VRTRRYFNTTRSVRFVHFEQPLSDRTISDPIGLKQSRSCDVFAIVSARCLHRIPGMVPHAEPIGTRHRQRSIAVAEQTSSASCRATTNALGGEQGDQSERSREPAPATTLRFVAASVGSWLGKPQRRDRPVERLLQVTPYVKLTRIPSALFVSNRGFRFSHRNRTEKRDQSKSREPGIPFRSEACSSGGPRSRNRQRATADSDHASL